MYGSEKKFLGMAMLAVSTTSFALLVPLLTSELPPSGVAVAAGVFFTAVFSLSGIVKRRVDAALRFRAFRKGETRLLSDFIDRLRFCFTTDDLIRAFRETLEFSADCTVLLIDMSKRYMVYNSPGIIGADPGVFADLVRRYDQCVDGVRFFDEKLDLVSDNTRARGFFVVKGDLHAYFFLRLVRVMESEIFAQVDAELASFLKRNETIEKMFSIAAVSREWALVAETQRSFLPRTLPATERLELAAHFQPLVNVSGDYYDVLPIDADRTLLVLGDVSGKGLAAALVMGVVVNTIRIIEDKTDLQALVRSVDAAIKGMRLQDKYTVLFMGIVDTADMTLRYVNASMADPLIISETGAGRQIRRLPSNCSIIGILDLESVPVAEARIFPGDVILMASDGVSEVPDAAGEMLGDSERWIEFVTEESARPVGDFVDALAALVAVHAGGVKLRDDVTMLAARVRG